MPLGESEQREILAVITAGKTKTASQPAAVRRRNARPMWQGNPIAGDAEMSQAPGPYAWTSVALPRKHAAKP